MLNKAQPLMKIELIYFRANNKTISYLLPS